MTDQERPAIEIPVMPFGMDLDSTELDFFTDGSIEISNGRYPHTVEVESYEFGIAGYRATLGIVVEARGGCSRSEYFDITVAGQCNDSGANNYPMGTSIDAVLVDQLQKAQERAVAGAVEKEAELRRTKREFLVMGAATLVLGGVMLKFGQFPRDTTEGQGLKDVYLLSVLGMAGSAALALYTLVNAAAYPIVRRSARRGRDREAVFAQILADHRQHGINVVE